MVKYLFERRLNLVDGISLTILTGYIWSDRYFAAAMAFMVGIIISYLGEEDLKKQNRNT